MSLIKLDKIDSTNDFLKNLSIKESLGDFTVVLAEFQTKGKGMGEGVWQSNPGENMLCSTYFKPKNILAKHQFFITMLVSLVLVEFLETVMKQLVSIKWPNDIIVEDKKIAGILQENIISSNGQIKEIILGIGLNVNQAHFAKLEKAISLFNITGDHHNIENLAVSIVQHIKDRFVSKSLNWSCIKESYEAKLWKRNENQLFRDPQKDLQFFGNIQGVTEEGLLKLKVKDQIRLLNFKKIQMLY